MGSQQTIGGARRDAENCSLSTQGKKTQTRLVQCKYKCRLPISILFILCSGVQRGMTKEVECYDLENLMSYTRYVSYSSLVKRFFAIFATQTWISDIDLDQEVTKYL